jgi:hypothetical protein
LVLHLKLCVLALIQGLALKKHRDRHL